MTPARIFVMLADIRKSLTKLSDAQQRIPDAGGDLSAN